LRGVRHDFSLNEKNAAADRPHDGGAGSERNGRSGAGDIGVNAMMSSFRNLTGFAAAAALAASIGIAATPAHAVVISNSPTLNALTAAGGSAIDELNGVVVEVHGVPKDNPDLDWSGPGDDE
jgi:hypothetical protein